VPKAATNMKSNRNDISGHAMQVRYVNCKSLTMSLLVNAISMASTEDSSNICFSIAKTHDHQLQCSTPFGISLGSTCQFTTRYKVVLFHDCYIYSYISRKVESSCYVVISTNPA